jgi:diguanylate cyclase (GGDEF)-like protein/PAS domain S-box-containing protein
MRQQTAVASPELSFMPPTRVAMHETPRRSAADLPFREFSGARKADLDDPGPSAVPGPVKETMSGEDEVSFEFLADNCTDIICRAGVDMVLHYASPSSIHILGWKPEEMIGKRPHVFVLSEDASAFRDSFLPRPDNSLVTVRMRRKDGTIAWIEMKYRLVRDTATGEPKETLIVMRDITERRILEERLSLMAPNDPVTGLSTHRTFDEVLEREWSRAFREGSRLSLLLLDFHHFRQFHGRQSHLEGDSCLPRAASAVMRVLRATDLGARYGAEEIAVILPATGPAGATKVASKLRSAVEILRSPHRMNLDDQSRAAVSIGISTALARSGGTMRSPEVLILAADHALQQAKLQESDTLRRFADALTQRRLTSI